MAAEADPCHDAAVVLVAPPAFRGLCRRVQDLQPRRPECPVPCQVGEVRPGDPPLIADPHQFRVARVSEVLARGPQGADPEGLCEEDHAVHVVAVGVREDQGVDRADLVAPQEGGDDGRPHVEGRAVRGPAAVDQQRVPARKFHQHGAALTDIEGRHPQVVVPEALVHPVPDVRRPHDRTSREGRQRQARAGRRPGRRDVLRNQWKDGEETKALVPDGIDNVVYDYQGTVYCHCPVSNERYEMAFCGFEKDRKALKYKCPAAAYAIECKGYAQCSQETKGKTVRIPLDTDRRIFVPIARSSYKWQRRYKGRTAVERVNSRIDLSFGFEHHFIRGKAKMTLRVGLALLVMISMALARIKRDQEKDMRSLIKQVA